MASGKGILLSHTDFPLYSLRVLDDRHFLVAGGGGQAKTGVANCIEIYELKATNDGLTSSHVVRHETGTRAVMNSSCLYDGRNHHLATGQDEFCITYSVKYKVVTPDKLQNSGETSAARKRKDINGGSGGAQDKQLTFEFEKTGETVTDFLDGGGFQKCVRFSPDFKQLATGGADGYLRVWKYPWLEKLWEVKAHTDEVDDLDFFPTGEKIVTVSRDKSASLFDSADGKKVKDLVWNQKAPVSYRFKFCRFGVVEGRGDRFNLYTVNIPVTRLASSQCYLSLWDVQKLAVSKAAAIGSDMVSAFCVSNDGIYLGVGYISGSISVHISFSLQRLHHVKEAHNIFVTGVEFLPSSEAARMVLGDQDFSLLSISADNTVRLHQCPQRTSYNPIFIIIAAALLICLLFYIMAELGI